MSWIAKDASLTQAEMENNAWLFYNYYNALGYSLVSISAMCGNAQAESTINPAKNEVGGTGYGIFQWTPKSVLVNHCTYFGLSPYTDGDIQLACMHNEMFTTNSDYKEWFTSSNFIKNYLGEAGGATEDMVNVSAIEFKENIKGWSVSKMAIMFMVGYLRPSYNPEKNHWKLRQQFAENWYEFFSGSPVPPTPTTSKSMPLYMMLRRF